MSTHLVKHQKITKRQIKEDPLVTAAFKATAFWERHGSRVLVAAGAVGLLGLLAFFMMQARAKAEEKASGDLFRATMAVAQGDYASAIPMFKEIVDNQPGTRASRDAMLYLGDSYAATGKPQDAATWYRKYVDKSHGDKEKERVGYLGLGASLEDGGEFAQAAAAYAESVKRSDNDNQRGRALFGQARSLLRGGQSAKAAELFRTITRLPDAEQPLTEAAKERLGEIEASQPAP